MTRAHKRRTVIGPEKVRNLSIRVRRRSNPFRDDPHAVDQPREVTPITVEGDELLARLKAGLK